MSTSAPSAWLRGIVSQMQMTGPKKHGALVLRPVVRYRGDYWTTGSEAGIIPARMRSIAIVWQHTLRLWKKSQSQFQ